MSGADLVSFEAAQNRIDAMCRKIDACLARVEAITSPAPMSGPNGGRPALPPNETLIERARLLRANGRSFQQIGDILGISRQDAWRLVHRPARKTHRAVFGQPSKVKAGGKPRVTPSRPSSAILRDEA